MLRVFNKYKKIVSSIAFLAMIFGILPQAFVEAYAQVVVTPITASDATVIATGLDNPSGLAVTTNGSIYVADTNSNSIMKMDSSGNTTTVAGGFTSPNAVAVDNNGSIFVADGGNGIKKIDLNGNKSNGAIVSDCNLLGIALDSKGNTYVTDNHDNTVKKIDSHDTITTLNLSTAPETNWSLPQGIAVDSSDNIYVVDNTNNVYKIDSSNNTNISTINSSFNTLIAVAVDSSNNVYVLDGDDGSIYKMDSNGNNKTLVGSGFSNCTGIAVDVSGKNIYLTDASANNVIAIKAPVITTQPTAQTVIAGETANFSVVATGSAISYQWQKDGNDIEGANSSTLSIPNAQASNAGSYTVELSNTLGTVTSSAITLTVNPSAPSQSENYVYHETIDKQYPNLRGIAISGNDKYVVSCPSSNDGDDKVYKYTADGNATAIITGLNYPTDVVTSNSAIYVVDGYTQNPKVLKYDSNGQNPVQIGAAGNGEGQYSLPYSMDLDNQGNIYVTDFNLKKILKFNANGTFDKEIPCTNTPYGIAIDRTNGYVYVTELDGYTVKKYNLNLEEQTVTGAEWIGLHCPVSLTVDSVGNVFVLVNDFWNENTEQNPVSNCVKKFDSNGKLLATFGETGISNGQFNEDGDIAVDAQGNVYVTDVTSRIQRFSVASGSAATPAYTAEAVAANSTPTAGVDNIIRITVKDSSGNTDTNFTGLKNVTVSGYTAAPNSSYGKIIQSMASLNVLGNDFAGSINPFGEITTPSTTKDIYFERGESFLDLALNNAAAQNIVFSVEGVNTPNTTAITITPVPAAAASMKLIQDITAPSSNGGQFAQQPKVAIRDQYWNICTNNSTVPITASKNDSGAWTLTGATTVAAIEGIANFDDLGATNTAAVTGAQLLFNTAELTPITSSSVNLPAPASSSNGGSSSSSSGSSSSSNTITGSVLEGSTGNQVSSITASVTTDSNGNKTISMKASEAVSLKAPDGTTSPLVDISKVSITTAEGTPITIAADGTVKVENLAKGTDNKFEVTYDLGNGQKIVIGNMEIKVGSNGEVSLTNTLIDPYGVITDVTTGKVIEGANVTLYYANTARNKAAGKTPDTVVALPGIEGFKPNNNKNPQISDSKGTYGFMVFPTSDYYIVVTKDGYHKYISPVISVEQEIVKWDIRMNPENTSSQAVGVQRLAGQTRIDTALSVAKATYSGKVSNVVLVASEDYPDALSGSVLAYKLNAPMLLIGSTDQEKEKVLSYMKSNMDSTGSVYLLGGQGVLGKDFEDKVVSTGFNNVTRIGGVDRYETSEKIAEKLNVNKETAVVVVSGENYPDALSVSSIAAVNQYPILLVRNDGISDTIKKEISTINPTKVFIIGLEGSVGSAVENNISQLIPIEKSNVTRIGGKDRFETSLEVGKYFNLTGNEACVATGNSFPDALVGSIYAAKYNAPIILVNDNLSDNEILYLKNSKLSGSTIFGGEGVVNKNIEQQISQIIGK